MAGNTQPQFTAVGNIGSCEVTAANTNSDGTGNIGTPTIYVAFTAGANGSYVEFIRFMAVSTSAASSSTATVMRVYISSVSSGATSSANTYLIAEIALPVITADQTTIATNWYDAPLGFRLPATWTILVSSHVAQSTGAIRATVIGGDY
jgi:hypothetical protein